MVKSKVLRSEDLHKVKDNVTVSNVQSSQQEHGAMDMVVKFMGQVNEAGRLFKDIMGQATDLKSSYNDIVGNNQPQPIRQMPPQQTTEQTLKPNETKQISKPTEEEIKELEIEAPSPIGEDSIDKEELITKIDFDVIAEDLFNVAWEKVDEYSDLILKQMSVFALKEMLQENTNNARTNLLIKFSEILKERIQEQLK